MWSDQEMTTSIDHLVVAGTDLSALVAWWVAASGQQPAVGGAHVGIGTKNALVGLGSSYLELVGPDPAQDEPPNPRPFGIDDLPEHSIRFSTFALGVRDIDEALDTMKSVGVKFGMANSMSREKPDGSILSWRLAVPAGYDGVMPFLIEWGPGTEHPSSSLDGGCEVVSIGGQHPEGELLAEALEALDAPCTVDVDPRPGLTAELSTPKGSVEL